jgi:prepilin-type N-terminal cleavage/methylation domain-containing protein
MVDSLERTSAGFTLIEMLVVIVVIGILASIAVVSYGSTTEKANVAAMRSDLRNLVAAEQSYYADQTSSGGTGTFTRRLKDLEFSTSPGVTVRIKKNNYGWSARATHAAVKNVKCAVYQGSIKPFSPATREGEVTCS